MDAEAQFPSPSRLFGCGAELRLIQCTSWPVIWAVALLFLLGCLILILTETGGWWINRIYLSAPTAFTDRDGCVISPSVTLNISTPVFQFSLPTPLSNKLQGNFKQPPYLVDSYVRGGGR